MAAPAGRRSPPRRRPRPGAPPRARPLGRLGVSRERPVRTGGRRRARHRRRRPRGRHRREGHGGRANAGHAERAPSTAGGPVLPRLPRRAREHRRRGRGRGVGGAGAPRGRGRAGRVQGRAVLVRHRVAPLRAAA
ncbi:hypothetical protein B7486_65780, partial [cyanobacterium TDX16]